MDTTTDGHGIKEESQLYMRALFVLSIRRRGEGVTRRVLSLLGDDDSVMGRVYCASVYFAPIKWTTCVYIIKKFQQVHSLVPCELNVPLYKISTFQGTFHLFGRCLFLVKTFALKTPTLVLFTVKSSLSSKNQLE